MNLPTAIVLATAIVCATLLVAFFTALIWVATHRS